MASSTPDSFNLLGRPVYGFVLGVPVYLDHSLTIRVKRRFCERWSTLPWRPFTFWRRIPDPRVHKMKPEIPYSSAQFIDPMDEVLVVHPDAVDALNLENLRRIQ